MMMYAEIVNRLTKADLLVQEPWLHSPAQAFMFCHERDSNLHMPVQDGVFVTLDISSRHCVLPEPQINLGL